MSCRTIRVRNVRKIRKSVSHHQPFWISLDNLADFLTGASTAMGSACQPATPPEKPKSTNPNSPHTPEEVNKITPTSVPSKKALMRLFNDYDLDG